MIHEHDFVEYDDGRALRQVCQVCSAIGSVFHIHVWSRAFHGDPAFCNVCGVERDPVSGLSKGHGHEWVVTTTLTGPDSQQCSICGSVEVRPRLATGFADLGDAALKASSAMRDFVDGGGDGVSETAMGEEAARFIFWIVRRSPEPLKAGGEWITKITNGITEAIREGSAE